jgi:hypothetical protein
MERRMADSEIDDKLLVEEYKSCRDLIGRNIEIIERSEVYAIGATAAIAVFCLSRSASQITIAKTACWMTLLIPILGLVRFIGVDDTIDKINNYLVELEKKHPSIGWTTSYRAQNRYKILKKSRYAIWVVLIVFSIVFIGFIYCAGPLGAAPHTP